MATMLQDRHAMIQVRKVCLLASRSWSQVSPSTLECSSFQIVKLTTRNSHYTIPVLFPISSWWSLSLVLQGFCFLYRFQNWQLRQQVSLSLSCFRFIQIPKSTHLWHLTDLGEFLGIISCWTFILAFSSVGKDINMFSFHPTVYGNKLSFWLCLAFRLILGNFYYSVFPSIYFHFLLFFSSKCTVKYLSLLLLPIRTRCQDPTWRQHLLWL